MSVPPKGVGPFYKLLFDTAVPGLPSSYVTGRSVTEQPGRHKKRPEVSNVVDVSLRRYFPPLP